MNEKKYIEKMEKEFPDSFYEDSEVSELLERLDKEDEDKYRSLIWLLEDEEEDCYL